MLDDAEATQVQRREGAEEAGSSRKNIVLCSDGTGNSGGKTRGTNVWRIFNAIDRHDKNSEQITFYDDGVGTDTLRWPRLLGGAFGWGLGRNLQQLYSFLVVNYEEGDRVFLFGFSRGAFTVRSLAGMICRCGLLDGKWFLSLSSDTRNASLGRVLGGYRSATVVPRGTEPETPDEKLQRNRKLLGLSDLTFRSRHVPVHFLGVWDTVDAVGVPFDDLKVIDWISRRLCKRRLWGFHDRTLSSHVHHAYHALALDDERRTFHPNVWLDPYSAGVVADEASARSRNDADTGAKTRQQVWFAGVHSNVGGGYPKDSLSLVSLDWMMGKAEACGLRFITGRRQEVQNAMDAHGRLYDSRAGFGVFYRYAARNLYESEPDPLPDDAGLLSVIHYTLKKCVRYVICRLPVGTLAARSTGLGGFARALQAYVRPLEPVRMPKPHVHVSVRARIAKATAYYAPKVIGDPSETAIEWTDVGPYSNPNERS